MSLLIESIKLLDGKFFNLSYHGERMRNSLVSLFGRVGETVGLEKILRETEYPEKGLYKCRVVYDDRSHKISFDRYHARRITKVRVVTDDEISYAFKFADRQVINRLFEKRGDCDDVIIVRKGIVTDCSYSNIVFKRGREWLTPDTPLLRGTMRQKLLDENKITAKEIRVEDIRSFDTCRLINAMLEFEGPEIEVSNIVF